ncbi:2-dehydro-3-deoxygalactonokinase [Vibrio maritimus]|uniref:2-dehydro-3-deoxygalactonokinase n=1 Tax=Vibrio maritimus TaxID=990268 RepID=UPI001F39EF16|nr:2-dehydro-3-deoxygalactonokinase [Vibrio maritimus]
MTDESADASWLVIDWGTTNFRAFAMSSSGKVIKRKEAKKGLLQVKQGEFANELKRLLESWLPNYTSLPVFMAGMVGSQQGWVDVPYAATPVDLNELAGQGHSFILPWGAPATIYPGVCHKRGKGQYDVMRGEEVQLIGAASLLGESTFHAVMPGTHSKYALMEDSCLKAFSTFMTGEMYSVLSQHTILGRGLSTDTASKSAKAFLKGVEESSPEQLTRQLFLVRTHRLFENLKQEEVLDYLSGLLIGHEIKSVATLISSKDLTKPVNIIGSHGLNEKYQLAFNAVGLTSQILDGDRCFIEGMKQLQKVIANETSAVV